MIAACLLAFAGIALALAGIVAVNRARAPDSLAVGFVGFGAGIALLAIAIVVVVL